jgi:membrane protein YdbS with pleckstrin-like domain
MRTDPTTAFVGLVGAMLIISALFAVIGWGYALLVLGAVVVFVALAWLLITPCSHCNARGTIRWHHTRVDGGPDRRYSSNYQYCTKCGTKA